jgi:hypothetical protein
MSPSDRTAWESGRWFEAESCAGVRYRLRRISVAGKIELARKVREIGRGVEFLEASGDAREQMEAAVLAAEIERAYLEWGLERIEGLSIDGEAATPQSLVERGPLALATEMAERIRAECGLREAERKN